MLGLKNIILSDVYKIFVIIFCISINGTIWAGCNNVSSTSNEETAVEEEPEKFTTKDFQNILSSLENSNFHEFYHNFGNGELKASNTYEKFEEFFSFAFQIFGNMSNSQLVHYDTARDELSNKLNIFCGFNVNFEHLNGLLNLAIKEEGPNKYSVSNYRILLEENVEFPFEKTLTSETLQQLLKKDYKKLYNNATERFKNYTPDAEYKKLVEFLDTIDFTDPVYVSCQIGADDENVIIAIRYHLKKSKLYCNLVYIKNDDKFVLNGLNFTN
jgi:hypothetical protein